MSSERKLEANRSNAQQSTGPKTPEGKAVSSLNALKLGLFARDCVLPDEARRDFNEFLAALREEHQPATPEEDFLVQAVAAAHWRLHRLIRMETGLFLHILLETGKYGWDIDVNLSAPEDPNDPPIPGEEYHEQTRLLGNVFSRHCSSDVFSKLARYENLVHRQFYRALNALNFYQARRAGQPPPRAL